MSTLDSKIPPGPIDKKWTDHKGHIRIVAPANKRRIDIIVVGTGLAGGAAAASLAEMGYNVKAFCFQDSPVARTASLRRAGSTLRRTTRTTATAPTACSTTP
jgi:NADPH-dependent 2,4-dienoyl-CoA reductase/sulfur reductase-like enzyme